MKTLKSFLYHNFNEKKSLGLLMAIILCSTIINQILDANKTITPTDFSCYEDLFYATEENISVETTIDSRIKPIKKPTKIGPKTNSLFNFDPNTTSKDSLQLLGISKYASNNLDKYLKKGGQINKKEDLQKIYGISLRTYNNLKDFIKIENSKNEALNESPTLPSDSIINNEIAKNEIPDNISEKTIKNLKPILIDINQADEIQLQYVSGIGPAFAKRIVKYRNLLGGYHQKNQLLEVYGLDIEKFNEIKDQITVSKENFSVININTDDYKELSKHPYISSQEARLLVAYKEKHGSYKNPYDIIKIGVMDSFFVQKIIPYLPDSLLRQKAHTPLTSL
jgi:DNA uptake protein ComE-like DNA-binding protein